MWPNPNFPADLVTFTKKILNRKLNFLCNVRCIFSINIFAAFVRYSTGLWIRTTQKLKFSIKDSLSKYDKICRFPCFSLFHSPIQSQQQKHQEKVWNIFKVNTRMTSSIVVSELWQFLYVWHLIRNLETKNTPSQFLTSN